MESEKHAALEGDSVFEAWYGVGGPNPQLERMVTQRSNSCSPPLKRWATRRCGRFGALALGAMCLLALNAGCARWSYERIRLGAPPGEYRHALSEATSRQTEIGLCSLYERKGNTEAIVLLTTKDRRVAGKFRVVHHEHRWDVMGEPTYSLEGEVDAALYGTVGAGPVDTLRALVGDIMRCPGSNRVREAHAWVAGGLVRIIQQTSDVTDVGIDSDLLPELLELAPAGGEASAGMDENGVFRVSYHAPTSQ